MRSPPFLALLAAALVAGNLAAFDTMAQSASRQFEPSQTVRAQPAASPDVPGGGVASTPSSAQAPKKLYIFFIDVAGATEEFTGPVEMTEVAAKAATERLTTRARTLGGQLRVKDLPKCAFVYRQPKKPLYRPGSGTTQSDAQASLKLYVTNGVTPLSPIVCVN